MNITSIAVSTRPVHETPANGAQPSPDHADGAQAIPALDTHKPATSNRITMSHGGRILNAADNGKDAATQAIENSKYPDEIKQLMIKIRELQAQLREKAAELQEVAADKTMAPRQREMKVTAIRETVATLTSTIQSTTATLNDAMTVMRMSSDDRKQIATMISAM